MKFYICQLNSEHHVRIVISQGKLHDYAEGGGREDMPIWKQKRTTRQAWYWRSLHLCGELLLQERTGGTLCLAVTGRRKDWLLPGY